MLFHKWKDFRQKAVNPKLNDKQVGAVQATFYAGAQGILSVVQSKWPAPTSADPVGEIFTVIQALDREIGEFMHKVRSRPKEG